MSLEASYLLRVITSNIKNSGTDANVFIDLFGTNGNTGVFKIQNQDIEQHT